MQSPPPAARSPGAPPPAAPAPAVLMRGIHKRFGAVQANRDVTLSVAAGTVHGIVGENGAGKSTLMSILYGFYQADSGSIEIEGRPAVITGSKTPEQASADYDAAVEGIVGGDKTVRK